MVDTSRNTPSHASVTITQPRPRHHFKLNHKILKKIKIGVVILGATLMIGGLYLRDYVHLGNLIPGVPEATIHAGLEIVIHIGTALVIAVIVAFLFDTVYHEEMFVNPIKEIEQSVINIERAATALFKNTEEQEQKIGTEVENVAR